MYKIINWALFVFLVTQTKNKKRHQILKAAFLNIKNIIQ